MKKERRMTKRKRKAIMIATTSLKIAPIAVLIALAGRWTWSNIGSDLKFQLGFDDVTKFLNNNKVIEEQVDIEETEEEIVEESIPEVEELEDATTAPINFPSIINQEEYVRISSELYDMEVAIPAVDWEGFNNVNEEVEAWIQIPGTKVNNVIVQGNDNEYYLHHDYKNEDDSAGSLFIDYHDNPLSSDTSDLSDVTTIYGHNLRSGKMFGTLSNYKSQSFYDRNPYGIITTESGDIYKLDFFAGIIVDGSDEANVYIPDFLDETEFNQYFDYVYTNSLFESDVDIQYGDKIIALSTCSYETDNARFLLFGRLSKQLQNETSVSATLGR